MKTLSIVVGCIILVVFMAVIGNADCNSLFCTKQPVINHHRNLQLVDPHANTFYYRVGYPSELRAVETHQMLADPLWKEFLKTKQEFAQFKAYRAGVKDSATGTEQVKPQAGLLRKHCASCHGADKATPSGDITIDTGVNVPDGTVRQVLKWLGDVEKPPEGQMTNVFKNIPDADTPGLLKELLQAEGF